MARLKKNKSGYYAKNVYLGKDENKKPVYKKVYGKTIAEAEGKADEVKRKAGRGVDLNVKQTFKLWADRFLADKKAEGVGASRLRSLENHINHLRPLWPQEIDTITCADLQDVLNTLADYHEVWWQDIKAPPMSKKSISEVKATAAAILDCAIVSRVLDYNPARYTRAPRGVGAESRDPLDDAQQQWVRDTPHRAQRAAMIMMYSGLRRGELSALTWSDIDLDAATIKVNKAIDLSTNTVKTPKTAAGARVVDIPQLLVDFLRAEPRAGLYIVSKRDGSRMTAQAWRTLWASYMADLNVKYGYNGEANKHAVRKKDTDGNARGSLVMRIETFTPHQLRHTFCSLLYLAGVDVMTARDQMGHADIKTTLAIYTHLDSKYKRKSMDKLDKYISHSDNIEIHG